MKAKYRKMLLILLPVIAVILVLQCASAILVNVKWGDASMEAGQEGEQTMERNVPEKTDALITYVKAEIEKIRSAGGSNDQLTDLFMECDAAGYVHLTTEGAPFITAKDGGEIMISQLTDNYESRITKKAFDQLIEISETYVAQAKNLKYGNFYTPFNDTTTNQIDCSSFTQLVLYGIPYETSRYATADDTNTAKYDLGFRMPDNPYRDEFGPYRYLANDLGKYALDNGFAFYPNEDGTNVQPGDVVFFSTNKNNEGYFMDITHVGICVERQEDDILYIVHGNNNDTVNYYKIKLFSDLTIFGSKNAYKNSLVLIARFPVKADD